MLTSIKLDTLLINNVMNNVNPATVAKRLAKQFEEYEVSEITDRIHAMGLSTWELEPHAAAAGGAVNTPDQRVAELEAQVAQLQADLAAEKDKTKDAVARGRKIHADNLALEAKVQELQDELTEQAEAECLNCKERADVDADITAGGKVEIPTVTTEGDDSDAVSDQPAPVEPTSTPTEETESPRRKAMNAALDELEAREDEAKWAPLFKAIEDAVNHPFDDTTAEQEAWMKQHGVLMSLPELLQVINNKAYDVAEALQIKTVQDKQEKMQEEDKVKTKTAIPTAWDYTDESEFPF